MTLKRHDENKEKQFWMADYRFLTFPGFQAKMRDFIVLSMLKQNIANFQIASLTGARLPKIEELKKGFEEGKK